MAERVVGIDFSGAEKAGDAIWIAEGGIEGERVRIESCRPAADLADSGPERLRCLPALVEFIAAQRDTIIGCDFPFSLPEAMVEGGSWRAFALGLGNRFSRAEDLSPSLPILSRITNTSAFITRASFPNSERLSLIMLHCS